MAQRGPERGNSPEVSPQKAFNKGVNSLNLKGETRNEIELSMTDALNQGVGYTEIKKAITGFKDPSTTKIESEKFMSYAAAKLNNRYFTIAKSRAKREYAQMSRDLRSAKTEEQKTGITDRINELQASSIDAVAVHVLNLLERRERILNRRRRLSDAPAHELQEEQPKPTEEAPPVADVDRTPTRILHPDLKSAIDSVESSLPAIERELVKHPLLDTKSFSIDRTIDGDNARFQIYADGVKADLTITEEGAMKVEGKEYKTGREAANAMYFEFIRRMRTAPPSPTQTEIAEAVKKRRIRKEQKRGKYRGRPIE